MSLSPSSKRRRLEEEGELDNHSNGNNMIEELKSYFDQKVSSMESKILQENERMNKKLKDDKLKTNVSFKAKGNKIQHEFNS